MSIYRQRLLAQQALIPRPIAAWSAKGKTNEDEDRAILKDLTGNGHDITLNNMAFSGMSGYGGYTVSKFTILENRFEGEYSNYKITVNKLLSSNTNISFITYSTTVVDISFKLQINGLPDGVSLRVWDHFSQEYLIVTNGVHTISLLNQNYNSTYIGLNGVTTEGTYNITIELLPEYPDALVFDGVDDYGICENMPIQDDYTFIFKAEAISATQYSNGIAFSKRTIGNQVNGAFVLVKEMTPLDQDDYFVFNYGYANNIDSLLPLNIITYLTKQTINGVSIYSGNLIDTNIFTIGSFSI